MDRHRLPFLHSPHGHPHHQRSLLYHPRPRHHLAMPSLPIYDNRHSMTFPRPYLDDYPPSYLPGPNPGSYGLMGLPSGGPYPMPVDYNYGFPGGYPLPIPPFPSQNSFTSMRKSSDSAAQYQAQYQAHMDALQDQVNSFLRLTSPPDPGKAIQKPASEPPDWTGVEISQLGRGKGSNGRTLGDVSTPRPPVPPKLHTVRNQAAECFASPPPRRDSLSSWHTTLTPPPLHLPPAKQSGFNHPPPLHTALERENSEGKKRKLETRNQNGVLSKDRIDDLFYEHCVTKMPRLPPLIVGNKDLAKKLTAKGRSEVLNLSSVKSTASAKRQLVSDSPDSDRNRVMGDSCGWEPVDGRNQRFTKNQSSNNGTGKDALLRDDGFVRDLGTGEHSNQGGYQLPSRNRPQDFAKSPGSSRSTTSYFPPPPPYVSSCLTDIEAMRSAYVAANAREGSVSSSIGCSEGESSARLSPPLLPPPPPLGFRGKGCFGVKRRRLVSPPGAQNSPVFSPPPVPPFRTEYGRIWDWSGENDSLDGGRMGKTFAPDVESRSGSGLYRPGHIAVPSNDREEATVTDPGLIRVKEEPIDTDPIDHDPFTQSVNNSFNSRNGNGALNRDEGQSLASTADHRDIDPLGKYDHDQSHLQEDTSSYLDVPFLDSSGGLLSPEFELSSNSGYRFSSAPASAGVEKRVSEGTGDDGNGEFRCHLCNYNGRSQHCLDKHFRAHGQACKICRYCLKAFERPSDLVRHEERHQKRNHMLASTTSDRPAQSSRFVLTGKRVKRRHAWTCRQCHFTCREARKLIQHTRRAHPIFVDCQICRMKFVSEAELAIHKATCHPVAVGRLDTYCRGVLTGTKLVTCAVTGEQEIALDLSELELSELPMDCSGIPVVSNVHDVQCILGKDTLDDQCSVQDLGHVDCSDPVYQVGNLSPIIPSGTHPVPRFFPSPVEYLCRTVKSLQNPPNPMNIKSPKDAECVDAAFDTGLTSTPTSLTILPKTDDVCVIGDTCKSPPVSGNLTDIHCDKPRLSPNPDAPKSVDSTKVSEKSLIASLKHPQFSRESVTATWNPPLQDSSSVSNLSRSETSPKFRAASHQKPSLLTKLLTKPKPAKPAVQTASVNRRVSETREKEISETVCALDKNKMVSTDFDTERTNTAENGTGITEESTPQVTISKKEQAVSKKDRSTNAPHKTEISTSDDGIGTTNSRKVFAERNGVEKKSETYVCVRCKYSTNAKFKYQQHLKAHNGRFICKRCNKACIKSSDLYRHWVTHNVKGPDGYFACDSCDFTSPQKYVVEDHMKQHYTLHPEQPQRLLSAMSRCGICQKNVLRSRLFEHKRVVHGKFFLKSRVNAETGRVETDANGNSIKSSLKVFACPQCDRKFTTPSYLLRHHFIHHQPSDGPTKVEENSCSCRFCGVKFEDVDRLQDHEINHILQTCTDTEYIERCHKRKKRISIELKRPSPVVSPIISAKSPKTSPIRRRLSCPHCKKTFKLQYFLDQHMRIHSGERPYVCQQCGAGFAIFQLLNIHRRFKCPHRKILLSTKKPLLNSRSTNASGDAFSNTSFGSKSGSAMLNGSNSGDVKDCLSAIMNGEHAVEVSG